MRGVLAFWILVCSLAVIDHGFEIGRHPALGPVEVVQCAIHHGLSLLEPQVVLH